MGVGYSFSWPWTCPLVNHHPRFYSPYPILSLTAQPFSRMFGPKVDLFIYTEHNISQTILLNFAPRGTVRPTRRQNWEMSSPEATNGNHHLPNGHINGNGNGISNYGPYGDSDAHRKPTFPLSRSVRQKARRWVRNEEKKSSNCFLHVSMGLVVPTWGFCRTDRCFSDD